jgi:hypothetical protein
MPLSAHSLNVNNPEINTHSLVKNLTPSRISSSVVHLQRGDAVEIAACVLPDRRGGVEVGSGQQLPVWGPGAGPHGAVVCLLKHILIETNRTDGN